MELTDEQKHELEQMVKTQITTTTMDQTVLNRVQIKAFIDEVVNESVLLSNIRVARRNEPSGEINRLYFDQPVTEDASITHHEHAPSETTVNFDTVKLRSTFDITSDYMEDIAHLSPMSARRAIAQMFAKQIANDIEQLGIEGDDSLSDDGTRTARLLKANDGFIQLMSDNVPSAQQIDVAGAGPSKALYFDMLNAMPTKYMRDKKGLKFIVSPYMVLDWVETVSERATGYGDAAVEGKVYAPTGIKFLEVPLMPTDLRYGTNYTDCTEIWLCNPKNLVYIIQRKITWEWERVPRSDLWEATVHTRGDFIIENEKAVVRAHNISMSGTDYS